METRPGVPQNGGNGGPVDREGVAYRKRTKRTCVGALRSKRGSCSSVWVWRTAKRDSTGYCSSPPSTSSSLHGLPSTSSSLHGLLFIQPRPRATPPATVQPPFHGHPSTVYCSSSPPWGGPVHPAFHRVLFIQPQPARSIGVLFIQRQHHGVLFIHPHRELFIQTPRNAHCSSRGSIDRLQLAAVAKESLDRVQLTAIDRSLGFSNA